MTVVAKALVVLVLVTLAAYIVAAAWFILFSPR